MVVDDLEEDEIDLSEVDHLEVETEVEIEVVLEETLEDQEEKINHISVELLEINNISNNNKRERRINSSLSFLIIFFFSYNKNYSKQK
jgi:hypothetical protein